MERRRFIKAFIGGLLVPFLLALLDRLPGSGRGLRRYLRPPGAKPEAEFRNACIGCAQCANVCPNKCISMQPLGEGLEDLALPAITARAKACILCMACTQVCPTDALEPLPATDEGKRAVNMGKAYVAEDLCYSFSGRTCGVCYRACPLPGDALTLGLLEQPTVHLEHCVGCGLCEAACVQMPQAIRVIPAWEEAARASAPPSGTDT
jgi:MauM/NapG family ferredoxin protein